MLARIRAGDNPADDIQRERETPTLREFADEYLRRCEPHWKPSGRRTMRIYLKARIVPAFGRMPLDRIGPEDVAAWFDAASRDKPARPTAPWRYYARLCFGPRNGDCASAAPTPVSGLRRTRGTTLPGSSTRTSWPGSGARSTPTRPAGPRPSPPSGCWRSPLPPQRSARSTLARHRRRRDQAPRFEDRPARRAARRGRAGAHRGAARRARPGRVSVSAPCPRPGPLDSHE